MRSLGLQSLCLLLCLAVVASGCGGDPPAVGPIDGGRMDVAMDASCPEGQVRCGDRCTALGIDPAHCGACGRACTEGMTCLAGSCQLRCPAPQSACGGQCVSTQTDPAHCGDCNRACPPGQVCSLGRCAATCDPTLAACGGSGDGGAGLVCADPRTDRLHCGSCGNACAPGQLCEAGSCRLSCPAGQVTCGETCRDLQTDDAHCGACGRACPPGNGCTAGACVPVCGAGLINCGGTCTNLQTDNASCGACGAACPAGRVCSGGACGTTCAAPLVTCGSGAGARCADTSIDPAHCGSCATTCALANASAAGCTDGTCVVVRCAAGFGDCDGSAANGCETSTATSAAHCGGCGRACVLPHATTACTAGACVLTACAAGYADCNRDPADGCEVSTATDGAHCGGCGTACAAGQVCSGGVCGATCAAPLATCGAAGAAFCADTTVDPSHCGGCGRACALPHAATSGCAARACTVGACAAGYGDCDGLAPNGCETDTAASLAHCGGCGRACALPNATAVCAAGACAVGACAAGYADCDRDPSNGCEVNTRTDNGSCGACGTTCAAGQVCSGGACGATCALPLTTCGAGAGAFCANTSIDPANCGACGTACTRPSAAVTGCSAGACTVVRCNAGAGDCDGDAANGCEANTQSSTAHCGGCGRACALPHATAACSGGACAIGACAAGYADCDGMAANGCEVNTRSDNASCGACGTVCPAGQVCSGGVCGATCGASLATCGSACADTTVDPSHCGGCGRACALPGVAVQACVRGACLVGSCAVGFGDCDGLAINGCETAVRGADVANCGGCGVRCAFPNASPTCAAGSCALGACASGYADCDGVAANGCEVHVQTDNAHCGACSVPGASRACAGGQVCSGGACGASCATGTTNCGGDCVRTATDSGNCGGCGNTCALPHVSVQACAAGSCVVGGCAAGFGDCDGSAANGCETNTPTSVSHCGGCGRACTLPHVVTQTCAGGACAIAAGACAAGYADCNGLAADGCEVNLRGTDGGNCGGCGTTCAAGQVCTGGACGTTCGGGLATCGSGPSAYCANTAVDPANCGGCGRACVLPGVATGGCASGACTVAACNPGVGDCNGIAGDGCETSTATSAAHCGGCGRTCALPHVATQTCTGGACAIAAGACAAGYADCNGLAADGCEVNTRSDNANCGACGASCSGGTTCSGGACGVTCQSPQVDCSGTCSNLANDPLHCGSCGTVCPSAHATAYCAARTCGFVCDAGYGNCDGVAANGCETALTTTSSHCGACGNACALPNVAVQSCAAGACLATSCVGGFSDCDGVASNGCETDTRTSASHCGGCGFVCGPYANAVAACAVSRCRMFCETGFADCNGGGADGCEIDLNSNSNCGTCGVSCSSGLGCAGGRCIAIPAPRLVAPLSTETSTTRRPSVRVALPLGIDGVRVEFCADRACTRVITSVDTTGATVSPSMDLPVGVIWWRAFGRTGTSTGTSASASWALRITGSRAPRSTRGLSRFDYTGDGIDDLLMSQAQCVAGPVAMLVEGAPGLASLTPRQVFVPDAQPAGFAPKLANAGDLNGDGFSDAAMSFSSLSGDTSRVAIYYGSALGASPTPSVVLAAPIGASSFFGFDIDAAGDVNGDGYADLLVGAQGVGGGAGRAYLYLGGLTGVPARPSFEFSPSSDPTASIGSRIAGLGDVDADGYEDFALAAPSLDRVYVYRGGALGPSTIPSQTITVAGTNEFGWSIDGAGDVNGDGYWDMVVGSVNVMGSSGRAYVFHGGPVGISSAPAAVMQLPEMSYDGFGLHVAGGSDVNGDGFADVIVVAGFFSQRIVLFHGGVSGISPVAGRAFDGTYSADTVALPGDLDSDGLGDVVIASTQFDSYRGRVYFYRGISMASTPSASLDGSARECRLGHSIAR